MKKTFLFTLLLTQVITVMAQNKHACCSSQSASSTGFASLSSNVQCRNAHESPLPFDYAAMGRMITFPTPDGKTGSAYYVPAKKQTKNFIFIIHEWWGLNDYIKQVADMYADSIPNANILALDLYDGKVATTADEAGKL